MLKEVLNTKSCDHPCSSRSLLRMGSVITAKADDESHSYRHLHVGTSDRFTQRDWERDKGMQFQRSSQSGYTWHPGLAAADARWGKLEERCSTTVSGSKLNTSEIVKTTKSSCGLLAQENHDQIIVCYFPLEREVTARVSLFGRELNQSGAMSGTSWL